MIRRRGRNIYKWIIIAGAFITAVIITQYYYNRYIYQHSEASLSIVDRTWLNYGEAVLESSEEIGLPANYLLALIALECGGSKEIKPRFEPHIFEKLQKVKNAESPNFETITTAELENCSEEGLKNLASSWGPFQLMGYQCLHLDIKIKELRGKKSVYYGCKWIKHTYGKYLEKKRFKDAFHLHNTGKKYPKIGPPRTHSRYYVPTGIKLMKAFEKLILQEQQQKAQ